MITDVFITAAIIAIIFLVGKILEMKFILKDNKPVKFIMRDGLKVYLSVVIGSYLIQQFSGSNNLGSKSPGAFIGAPDF